MDSNQPTISELTGRSRVANAPSDKMIEQEKSAIINEVTYLAKAVELSHVLIADLAAKLKFILSKEDVDEENSSDREREGTCDLYVALYDQTEQLRYLQRKIRRLIRSAEV